MINDSPEGKTNYCVVCENQERSNFTLVGTHTCRSTKDTEMEPMPQGVSISKWCVKCYPEKAQAEFTFQGDSLCEECFKKTALI